MAKRNVILIDQEKCTGCGQCVNACVGGALQLVNGKATVVREDYCDGLGVCVGECPVGALKVEQREAAEYKGTVQHHPALAKRPQAGHACPGMKAQTFDRHSAAQATGASAPAVSAPRSALESWPIQLHLVRPDSPQFAGTDVLIAASCSAFSCGAFHTDLLPGKALIIACPKLDQTEGYVEKLAELFAVAQPKSVTIARMEVPCCGGLVRMVAQARALAQSTTPVHEVVIGLRGDIQSQQELKAATA
ncbi:MAG: 4Fe-4S dicluster domain-containing protein [bacterium]|nr:4Fe-4S dicluster domain-containing protein [bacterium]